jgi:hypothetical protein
MSLGAPPHLAVDVCITRWTSGKFAPCHHHVSSRHPSSIRPEFLSKFDYSTTICSSSKIILLAKGKQPCLFRQIAPNKSVAYDVPVLHFETYQERFSGSHRGGAESKEESYGDGEAALCPRREGPSFSGHASRSRAHFLSLQVQSSKGQLRQNNHRVQPPPQSTAEIPREAHCGRRPSTRVKISSFLGKMARRSPEGTSAVATGRVSGAGWVPRSFAS